MLIHRRDVIAGLLGSAALAPGVAALGQTVPLSPPESSTIPYGSPSSLLPTWRRYAVSVAQNDERPKIAVVVDDMGATHPYTAEVVALPGPLTLAWFPFAPSLPEQIRGAAARGHEALMHMPMQSFSNSTAQTGPDPLRIDLPPAVNLARLKAALDAVPDVVGLNNHMGSVATRDVDLMDIVARETRERSMLFLDSVTIPHSVAAKRAELIGVPAASRDVFIDHTANAVQIREQLASIETFARRFGYAIAIGHPRPHTIEALTTWLPTLEGKGFVLWPIAATVALRNRLDLTMRA